MHGLRRIPVKAFVSRENMTETDVNLLLLKQEKHSLLLILEYQQPENKGSWIIIVDTSIAYNNKFPFLSATFANYFILLQEQTIFNVNIDIRIHQI